MLYNKTEYFILFFINSCIYIRSCENGMNHKNYIEIFYLETDVFMIIAVLRKIKKKQKENEIEFRDKIQDLYWISNEMSPGLSNLIIRERIQRKESKLINNDYYYGCVQMKKKKTS